MLRRILHEEGFTKTEYEYYSRQTKKKLQAILQLQDVAKALLPVSPIQKDRKK